MPPIIEISEDHKYSVDGIIVPGVTEILQYSGLIDYSVIPKKSRDWSLARGTAVHLACELLDKDDLYWPSLDPDIKGYIDAYQRFKSDSGFIPKLIEEKIYCPIFKYAGTLDRTGTMNGESVLVDLKTGPAAPWHGIQTAAYEGALPERYKRFVLHLKEDGSYKLTEFKDRNDVHVFRSYLGIYRWESANGYKNKKTK